MWPTVFAVVLMTVACNAAAPGNQPPGDDEPPGSAPDPVARLAAMPAACSADQWCWRKPTPHGTRLQAVFATGPDNLWLAGEAGYVLQWDGAQWRDHALPKPPFRSAMNLGVITGTGPSDMWIAGGELLYHWDGASWTLRDSVPPELDQQFHGVWEAPNGDVWVTMEYGVVRRSTAGGPFVAVDVAPAQAPLSALGSVWGTAADDVWIAGRPGRMFHWNGATFTEAATGSYKAGGNLWGARKDDIWLGGYDGTLVHWNGTQWAPVDTGLGAGWYIKGISAIERNPHDVWWLAQRNSNEAATLHWDGTSLVTTRLASDVVLDGLAIVGDRWWIAGDHGAVYVKRTADAALTAAIAPASEPFRAIWGTSDRDLYLAGPGVLTHWDGAAWASAELAVEDVHSICGVPGTPAEAWAVGSSRAADGSGQLADVFHLAGGAWTKVQIDHGHALTAVWAPAAGEALAVGSGGEIYRGAGGVWSQVASPVTSDLAAVWGPDPDHAWIVGAAGTILRWDRAQPDRVTVETSPIAGDLTAIHGAGGSTWITSNQLGSDGQVGVLQSSPTGWTRRAVPHLLGADAVFATSPSNVVIAGANNAGVVFRWNGTTFAEESTLSAGNYSAVFQPPGGSTWLVGDNAMLQHAP